MVVTELMGGMGNQMFQYALGRHLSLKNKSELLLDTRFLLDRTPRENFVYREYDLGIFNLREKFASKAISKKYGFNRTPETNIFQKIFAPRNLKYIKEERFEFTHEILHVGNNVYLNGYWQTEKYFKDVENLIRNDFTFKTPMQENSRGFSKGVITSNSICLHVRRLDFVNHPILGFVGMDYYISAVNRIKEQVSDPVLFVFSDEINWCKENFTFDCKTVFVSEAYEGKKLRDYFELMTMCKHFIIPNSTFSWWAAWLCSHPEKIVFAPKVWFQGGNWNYQDVVPQNWIKL